MNKSKSKKKTKANKAFLDKIKSLSFNVGGKVSTPSPCRLKLKGFGYLVSVKRHPRTPQERREQEQSFAC